VSWTPAWTWAVTRLEEAQDATASALEHLDARGETGPGRAATLEGLARLEADARARLAWHLERAGVEHAQGKADALEHPAAWGREGAAQLGRLARTLERARAVLEAARETESGVRP